MFASAWQRGGKGRDGYSGKYRVRLFAGRYIRGIETDREENH